MNERKLQQQQRQTNQTPAHIQLIKRHTCDMR